MKKNYPKNSLLSGLKFLKLSLNQTKTVRLLFLILFSCLVGNVVEAQTTRTSATSGNWNVTTTWVGGVVPGPLDPVIIKPGHTVTVTASASAASVTFDNNATAASNLTVNSGVSLTITGAVTLRNAAARSTNAAIGGAGTLLCGSLLIGSPVVNTAKKAGKKQNILSLKISTLKVSGNITLNNDDQGGGDSSQPVLDISGTCVLSANSVVFTHSGGGGGGASENIFNLGSGATLDLSSSVPFLVKYDDVALKDSHITINLKSGAKINFGCGVTPPTTLANGGSGGIDKEGPNISYANTTVSSSNTITTWKNLGTGNIGWDNGAPTLNNNIVFAADYSLDADVNGCSCIVTGNKNVIIRSGRTMKIVNEVKVEGNGTLTFENNASLVQIDDNAVNSGNIIYKRTTGDIFNTDYVYWSTPVADAKLAAIQTGTLYYSFNAAANSWVRQSATDPMSNGIGYIVRGAGTGSDNGTPFSKTVSFIGKPNNGVKNVVISAVRSNLIGNPYPSAIDADAFIIKNKEVLSGSLYFWTHKTAIQLAANITNGSAGSGNLAYTSDDYATYNLTGGTGTGTKADSDTSGTTAPSGQIAAGQAFFATASSAGGTASFNNSMRISGGKEGVDNSQFFKLKSNSKESSSIEKNRVWLNLTNTQGAFKQTLIGYVTGATNNYESAYDGKSLNANAFIDFYSVQNNSKYAIQGRALPFDDNDVVPLGFKSTIAGEFKIGIDQVDGLLSSKKIFIEDKLLGKVQDLSKASYDFSTEKGTFDDRFVLSYANRTLEVADNIDEKKFGVLIYNKNKEIVIESSEEVIDKVLIYDFIGKQVYRNTNINETDLKVSDLILINNQALIVKVILQNGETITKKIIL